MAEMSDRFLTSGRKLTIEEYQEHLLRFRKRCVERRLSGQQRSLFWLGHALGLPTSFDLGGMLRSAGLEGTAGFYHEPQVREKPEGGTRIIISPKLDLKLVQKRIRRLLRRTFQRHPNTFCHMGGSCLDVAHRHVEYSSTLKFDIQDAFFQVSFPVLKEAITGRRPIRSGFSRSVAHWITQLCVYNPPLTR